jgi:hypothetical protein
MAIPHYSVRRFVVAAAIVAVTAPAARAAEPPDGRYDPRVGVSPRVTIVEPSAFDWGDAGVGAAGAFGLIALASGIAVLVRPGHGDGRDAHRE